MDTKSHTQIGFANPYLKCDTCSKPVKYWHDPERCGCENLHAYNYPCKHGTEVYSSCPTWGPVDGCSCEEPCKK